MPTTNENAGASAAGASAAGAPAGKPAARRFVPLLHRQVLDRARKQIAGRRRLYPVLATLNVPPPYHALNVLKIIWTLLGYGPERLGDASAPAERGDKRAFSWSVARATISPRWVEELIAFDAEDVGDGRLTPKALERIKQTLETMLDREVNDQGPTFTPLLAYVKSAVAIRDTCMEQAERDELLAEKGLL